jgi:hypothetical protein
LPAAIAREEGSILQRDPIFADREAGDFHIPLSSPARAAGRPAAFGPVPDFDGRCWSDPPAIGAFEAGMPRKRWPPRRQE